MLKLYYAAGGCSIAPHIALREVGASFELVPVNLKTKRLADGSDFAAINAKNQIPALILEDGALLTETAAILQWIADLNPDAKIAPAAGTMERVRLQEWLNFITTELHKAFTPLFRNEASDEYKAIVRERVGARLAWTAGELGAKAHLLGETFTVADGYIFYVLRSWQRLFDLELPAVLGAYYQRLVARPSVKAALLAEGLQP